MDNEYPNVEAMREFAAAVQRAGEIIAEVLRPVVEALMEFCRKAYEAIHAEYVRRGAIYGDTNDGMLRWLEEIVTIGRLRQEAEYLEQRHGMLVEIRAMRL